MFSNKIPIFYGFCYQGLDEALLTRVIIIIVIIIMIIIIITIIIIIIIIIADLNINIRFILNWTKPCSLE